LLRLVQPLMINVWICGRLSLGTTLTMIRILVVLLIHVDFESRIILILFLNQLEIVVSESPLRACGCLSTQAVLASFFVS